MHHKHFMQKMFMELAGFAQNALPGQYVPERAILFFGLVSIAIQENICIKISREKFTVQGKRPQEVV